MVESPNSCRAVSPVLGVIVMVAITVILGAIVGTFALDTEQMKDQSGPQIAMTVEDMDADYDTSDSDAEDFLRMHHESGGEVDMNFVRITIRNESDSKIVGTWEAGFVSSETIGDWSATLNGETLDTTHMFTSGDVIEFSVEDNGNSPPIPADGTEYRVTIKHTKTDTKIAESVVHIE